MTMCTKHSGNEHLRCVLDLMCFSHSLWSILGSKQPRLVSARSSERSRMTCDVGLVDFSWTIYAHSFFFYFPVNPLG
jgi:hypothetical protein